MTTKMIFAGYGGQGMLLCGQLFAYAGMLEGKEVTWLPSYGPEMRGGSANCSVIISDNRIGSPVVREADVVVVMNQPSFDKFEPALKPGGLMICNTSLINSVPSRSDIRYIFTDITGTALALGNVKVANMIALGCLNEAMPLVQNASILEALKHKLGESKAKLIAINEVAIEKGKQLASEASRPTAV